MKAKQIQKDVSGSLVKHCIVRLMKHPAQQCESSGFCICPNCGHLVFDTALKGTCPYCRCRFCPSCMDSQMPEQFGQ